MATKFADIAKPPNDLLNLDYQSKIMLKCKKNAGPVAVTIETVQGEGGALSSKVGTKFSYAKFNVDKGELRADGARILETSLRVTDDVKLSFKSTKGADLWVDYCKGNFYATGMLDVLDMSKFSTSACMSLPKGIKVGGMATYGLASSKKGINDFSLGASYTTGPVFASMTTNKLSQVNIGLLYKVNDSLSFASQTSHSSDKICNVVNLGGAYKLESVGTIKAKYGSNGVLSACVVREIAPKVLLTASGSMSATDFGTFKPGLCISM